MDTSLLTSDNIYDAKSGHFISQAHANLAEVINLYNPDLYLIWIPPADRTENGPKPFGVAYIRDGQEPYVFMLLSELEMTDTDAVMARIIEADQYKSGNPLSRLQAAEEARILMNEKRELERRAEMHDRVKFLLRTPLHTVQLGGGKVLHT